MWRGEEVPTVNLGVFDQDVSGMMSLDSSLLSPLGHVIIHPVAALALSPLLGPAVISDLSDPMPLQVFKKRCACYSLLCSMK